MTPNDLTEFFQGIAAVGYAAGMISGIYRIYVLNKETKEIESSY